MNAKKFVMMEKNDKDIGDGVVSRGVVTRQAESSRWSPKAEQLTILEDMYASGIRNLSAEHTEQIAALLSLYGKIERKNVVYWFQNRKARDRQRQRLKDMNAPLKGGWKLDTKSAEDCSCKPIISSSESVELPDCYADTEYIAPTTEKSRPLETLELFPLSSGL
eukprot:Gb_29958 [translate_table: standard]